jgi:hypothetical protein
LIIKGALCDRTFFAFFHVSQAFLQSGYQVDHVALGGLRACLKSRVRGHVIVGVMTISTDIDKLYDTDLSDAAWALIAPILPAARPGEINGLHSATEVQSLCHTKK